MQTLRRGAHAGGLLQCAHSVPAGIASLQQAIAKILTDPALPRCLLEEQHLRVLAGDGDDLILQRMDTVKLQYSRGLTIALPAAADLQPVAEGAAIGDQQQPAALIPDVLKALVARLIPGQRRVLTPLGVAHSGNAIVIIQCLLQLAVQLGVGRRCIDHRMRDGAQHSHIIDALMCLAVIRYHTRPVNCQHNVIVHDRDIIEHLIVAALQEGGIHRKNRQQAAAGQP